MILVLFYTNKPQQTFTMDNLSRFLIPTCPIKSIYRDMSSELWKLVMYLFSSPTDEKDKG